MSKAIVDPEVSRMKFDREVAEYRALQNTYIRRGWWLTIAEFPTVFVVFGSNKGLIRSVIFGALIDFTNYDLWPPSVKLVDPFTMVPYKARELPYAFLRKVPAPAPTPTPTAATTPLATTAESLQTLMQAWGSDEIPFLCLPGVREYHENPAHTGDSWLLHRPRGEGTLFYILDQIYKYGVQPLQLQLQVQLRLQPDEVPT